ncbi:hypothetical protein [Pseudorhodoplanes sinuspersici]|uniref:Uncharacterized protein n=1 Tax=Pseudorhodoplanes sinuspersici TaxID=1235591 RepID=A0A1W6ZRU3_9HYPH|nr:hypothetical protein [Pseudorhodoplanes sinuspersici]ARP99987.1 hypothetical protein CAK95_13500 [Pseudorhodoplanes sinuspersici]RKE71017.1 hypothetical protein DFP91_3269 [Pseudorhodoplanes sinuspersici]
MRSAAARIAGTLAFALSVAACTTTGQPQTAGLQSSSRTTVAFESIDGPPPAVFQKLVSKLNDEAEARQVPVVTREGFAPYRVRGYTAVGVLKGQAVVSWVWDVYDSQSARVLRLSGEEKAGRAGKDAWQAVNDEVVARIARNGMQQLAGYFQGVPQGNDSAPAPAPAPDMPSTAVAANDDFRPETYGITRRSDPAPDLETAAAEAPVPTPRRRPSAHAGRVALAAPQ